MDCRRARAIEPPVVTLLELHRVDTRLVRGPDQLAGPLHAPLVVVADLGDHEAWGVVGDPPAVDRELAHGAIVAGARGRLDGRAATPITPFLPPADRDTVPQMPTTLSILMPVYNERSTLERAVDDALAAELPVEARQLVIVDDGSTDCTLETLRTTDWPESVTVVEHNRNQGKGAAIRTALTHATGDFAAILDVDLEYRAADLAPLLKPLLAGRPASSTGRGRGRAIPRSASGT